MWASETAATRPRTFRVLSSPSSPADLTDVASHEVTEVRTYSPLLMKIFRYLRTILLPLILLLTCTYIAVSKLAPSSRALRAAAPVSRLLSRLHRQQQNPFATQAAVPQAAIAMAWRCSAGSNAALIDNMWRHGLISDPTVKAAFASVDRAHYAPVDPYDDSPQAIGHHATISAPHMHASAVQEVLPFLLPSAQRPAPRVLDVGSGSGYLTHVLAELAGKRGLAVGVEHISELRDLGEENMKKSEAGRRLLREGRAKFRVGDGRLGLEEPAREGEEDGGTGWDVIHVGASAKEVHKQLLDQLKAPGCMFIPVDDDEDGYSQHIWRIEKDAAGKVTKKCLFGVRYVPLTDPPRRK